MTDELTEYGSSPDWARVPVPPGTYDAFLGLSNAVQRYANEVAQARKPKPSDAPNEYRVVGSVLVRTAGSDRSIRSGDTVLGPGDAWRGTVERTTYSGDPLPGKVLRAILIDLVKALAADSLSDGADDWHLCDGDRDHWHSPLHAPELVDAYLKGDEHDDAD